MMTTALRLFSHNLKATRFVASDRRNIKDSIFAVMLDPSLIKNLRKLNWIVSFMIALLAFIFVLAVTRDFHTALFRFLQSLLFTIILTFGNLILFARVNKNSRYKVVPTTDDNQTRVVKVKTKPVFYLFSYLITIADFLFVKVLYTTLVGVRWEGEVDNIYRAYSLALLAICTINSFIIIFQDVVILQFNKARNEIENLQLKSNVSEMSNLLLRQQIQPHFLFNALSTIKSLYKQDLAQGEEYLVHLVNFLRVSVSNHQTTTTLIKSELDFCMDYLKMQQMRFGTAFSYTLNISDKTLNSKYLPYFSLQSLFENALKHNDLSERSPMRIIVREDNGYLIVENTIHPPKYKEPSTGQGLSNLAERYRLLGVRGILINSDLNFFRVRIKILDK